MMCNIKMIKSLLMAGMIGLSGLLAGCGGGGAGGDAAGGGVTPPTTTTATISGTAATGAPLPVGTVITIKDVTNKTVVTTGNTVGENGAYTIKVISPENYKEPFILMADPPGNAVGDEHYSILMTALTDGASKRVNITPITSLILYEATKKSLATVFSDPEITLTDLTVKQLDQARDNVVMQLPALDKVANKDFIGQTFSAVPTDPYDAAMDIVDIAKVTFSGDNLVLVKSSDSSATVAYDVTVPLFPIKSISVAVGNAQQVADGASFNLITAKVINDEDLPAKGIKVNFAASAGALYDINKVGLASTAVTDSFGFARVYLKSGTNTGAVIVKADSSDNAASGTSTVSFISGTPAVIGLSALPSSVIPGGKTTLNVAVTDANGNLVADGQNVIFSLSSGSGSFGGAVRVERTTLNGYISLEYTAGNMSGVETIKATTTNGINKTLDLSVSTAVSSVAKLTLSASSQGLVANGSSSTTLTATASDSAGKGVPGATVIFSTSAGVVNVLSGVTDAAGVARATLTSGIQVLTALASASVNGITATSSISFTPGAVAVVGLNSSPSEVRFGGSSFLTIAVLDANGNAVANEPITLSFTQRGSGTPSLGVTSGTTNANGLLVVNYTAGVNVGADIISARASNGATTTTTINVSANTIVIGSIDLTASNGSIAVSSGTTILRATVKDGAGLLIANQTVNFSSSAGTLTAASAMTDSTGVAQVTLTAGNQVLTAKIEATIAGFADTALVQFTAGAATTVSVLAAPDAVKRNGTTTVTIAVVDGSGNPVANEPVNLSLSTKASGSPTLNVTSGTTNANGLLVVSYTAGAADGVDTVRAVASTGAFGTETINVNTSNAVVSTVSLAIGNSSIPVNGSTSLNATVRDNLNQPLPGIVVTFSSTGGTITPAATATTNAVGIATVTLSAGANVQTANVSATASNVSASASGSVNFTAGAAATVGINAAPNAVKPGNSSIITIAVVDINGNAVANEPVTLTFGTRGSGTPSLSAVSGTTDINGLLLVNYTAGANTGSDTIIARASNGATEDTTINVAPANIVIGSVTTTASNGSIPVTTGTTVIRATVRDSAGALVSGTAVNFTSTAGTLSSATAPTDANGIAQVTLTAGAAVLSARIEATISGFTGAANVNFTAGAPNTVTVSAAPNAVNPGMSSTISAYVVDASLNPVVGETVTFSIPTKGSGLPTLAVGSAVTNVNGLAVVTYTAGAGTGNDTVRAVTSNEKVGTIGVTVSTTATVVGSITLISGTTTLPADGASEATMRATVLTSSGLPASGVPVNFRTTGGQLSLTSVVTDASGVAEVRLTSPERIGTVTVVAEASGFLDSQDVVIVASQPHATKFALFASPASVNAGGSSGLTAIVLDVNGNPVVGQTVTFTIILPSNAGGSVSPVTATTSASGIATTTYSGGSVAGTTDTIRAALVGGLTTTTTVTVTGRGVTDLSIVTSRTSVKTDGSEIAVITVTALSSQNVVVPGVTISFSANGGQLSASQVLTNASGQASVNLSAGTFNKSNRVITVTASTADILGSVQIPVRIVDSTVALVTTNSTMTAGGDAISVTVTARDASGLGIFGTPVTLIQSSQSGGAVSIVSATGNTDVNGQFTTELTGFTPGSVTLTASGLGATASQVLTVTPGSTFAITAPLLDPAGLTTTGTLAFTVNAPNQFSVRFATTLGVWSGLDRFGAACTSVCEKAVAADSASATLASANTGTANIQVDGLDVGGNVTGTDKHTALISATASSSVSLQGGASNVPPSSGGTVNTVALTATVRDAFGQPVGGVPVAFSILNTTSGGETISPVVKLSSDGINSTDPLGQARTTFTSGSLPSGQSNASIRIQATALDSGETAIFNIVVGGTAGSLAIGQATKIELTSTTQYTYPMSVLVADSNGNPAPDDTVVSLSIWPVAYSTGVRNTTCDAVIDDVDHLVDSNTDGDPKNDADATYPNEDTNENLILDAGDTDALVLGGNGDGRLTPPNSSAGFLPSTKPTENGVANFNLVYLKEFADWVVVRVRANALVQGTETTTQLIFRLPAARSDAEPCTLSDSPFTHP